MFNKNINNGKIIIKQNKYYKYKDILFTPSFIAMLNKQDYDKKMYEKMDYQDRITSYINRKNENEIKKVYNPKIVTLYEDGYITIEDKEYPLKEFYIVFMDKNNEFHLKCINNDFNNENYEYNKAIKFIDTTAFINLINDSNIKVHNNKVLIDDKNILNNYIQNWDGYLHSETKETDAILNKKMIEDKANE